MPPNEQIPHDKSFHFLVNKIKFEVPIQNLIYSLVRMPTENGFVMENIRWK